MRNPDNIKDSENIYGDEPYTILKIDSVPKFDIEEFDLLDEKQFNKFIQSVEKSVRTSFEYKCMVKYLRDNMDMNKCSFYENINNTDTFKIKIHIHHHPFTLFDICNIVYNKRCSLGQSTELEAVANEVTYLHYAGYVGLIPLSETVHELVHGNYIFIPLNKVYGKYDEFYNMYKEYMKDEECDLYEKNLEFSKTYEENIQENPLLVTKHTYLDLTGLYKLPKYEEVISIMDKKLKDIKNDIKETGIKFETNRF